MIRQLSLIEETNFNEKGTFKTQIFYMLLAFLLNSIALLIAISIYCCLVKYEAKMFTTISHQK